MSFKSFFKHLGHAIEHAAVDVAHGVEHAAKDIAHAGEAAMHMVGDLAQLKFKSALNDAVQCAQYSVKAATEMPKAEMEAVCDATSDLHLNKSLDKIAQKVKNIGDKVVDTERSIANKVVSDVAGGVEGAVSGTINMAKDVAHGDFGKAFKDGMGAVGGALTVAADLTPEGLAATAVVDAMQVGHVGSEKLQGFVGDVVGGPKGLFKRAAESGAGMALNEAAGKVGQAVGGTPGAGSGALAAVALGAPLAGEAFGGRRGHGHGQGGEAATTRRDVATTGDHPGAAGPGAPHEQQPAGGHDDMRNGRRDERGDEHRNDRRDGGGSDRVQTGLDVASSFAAFGQAGSTMGSIQVSAAATIAAQDAIAAIQNAIALNQAKNQVEDELGKGVKALSQ